MEVTGAASIMQVQGFSQPHVYQGLVHGKAGKNGLREGMRILQDPHLPP